VLLQVAVVQLGFLNVAFHTVPLTFDQWWECAAMASVVLWFSEVRKLASRASANRPLA
jgi:P-type Ca2+ transporter type 2C